MQFHINEIQEAIILIMQMIFLFTKIKSLDILPGFMPNIKLSFLQFRNAFKYFLYQ